MNLYNPPAPASRAPRRRTLTGARAGQDSTRAATPSLPGDQPRAGASALTLEQPADAARAAGRARPLPWPAARRRVTGAALAAAGYAATLAAVIAGVPLSRAAAVQVLFAATMIVCALAETLHSPAAPAIGADSARPAAAARAGRLRTRALAAGCLLGPSAGGAALGAGWGTSLLTALAVACALAGIATQRPPANITHPSCRA